MRAWVASFLGPTNENSLAVATSALLFCGVAALAGRDGRCATDLTPRNRELSLGTLRGNADAFLLLAGCAYMAGEYSLAARASDLAAADPRHELAALYWSIKAMKSLRS
jgi:hypothetical protein